MWWTIFNWIVTIVAVAGWVIVGIVVMAMLGFPGANDLIIYVIWGVRL